jgi:hypothetical protein
MSQAAQRKTRAKKTKGQRPWNIEKALLIEDVDNGTTIHAMQPAAIYTLRPEYEM